MARRSRKSPLNVLIESGSVENWDLFFQHYRKSRAWREHLLRSALEARRETAEQDKPERMKSKGNPMTQDE